MRFPAEQLAQRLSFVSCNGLIDEVVLEPNLSAYVLAEEMELFLRVPPLSEHPVLPEEECVMDAGKLTGILERHSELCPPGTAAISVTETHLVLEPENPSDWTTRWRRMNDEAAQQKLPPELVQCLQSAGRGYEIPWSTQLGEEVLTDLIRLGRGTKLNHITIQIDSKQLSISAEGATKHKRSTGHNSISFQGCVDSAELAGTRVVLPVNPLKRALRLVRDQEDVEVAIAGNSSLMFRRGGYRVLVNPSPLIDDFAREPAPTSAGRTDEVSP